MTRQTSIDAYYDTIKRGTNESMRWLVFDSLIKNYTDTGITSNETWQFLVDENRIKKMFDSNTVNIRSRFTELREMGLIKELEPRACKITGVRCIAWAPTWATDIKKLKRKPSKDKRIKQLKALLIEACGIIEHNVDHFDDDYTFLNKSEIKEVLK